MAEARRELTEVEARRIQDLQAIEHWQDRLYDQRARFRARFRRPGPLESPTRSGARRE